MIELEPEPPLVDGQAEDGDTGAAVTLEVQWPGGSDPRVPDDGEQLLAGQAVGQDHRSRAGRVVVRHGHHRRV